MLSHPEMTREQAEALYAKVDPTDVLVADAYERGRRDENEACAKVAEQAVAAWESAWASGRDGGALEVGHAIRARIKEGASE